MRRTMRKFWKFLLGLALILILLNLDLSVRSPRPVRSHWERAHRRAIAEQQHVFLRKIEIEKMKQKIREYEMEENGGEPPAVFDGNRIEAYEIGKEMDSFCTEFFYARLSKLVVDRAWKAIQERCEFLSGQAHHLADSVYRPAENLLALDLEMEGLRRHIREFMAFVYSQYLDDSGKFTSLNHGDLLNHLAKLRRIIVATDNPYMLQQRKFSLENSASHLIKEFQRVQNPEDCQQGQVLVCDGNHLRFNRGYGSRTSFIVWCLTSSLAAQRRLVLHTTESFLLDRFYEPIIGHCPQEQDDKMEEIVKTLNRWPSPTNDSAELIVLPNVPKTGPFSLRMPPHIPSDLNGVDLNEVWSATADPSAWYVGVLANYMMKPNSKLKTFFRQRLDHYGIQTIEENGGDRDQRVLTAGIQVRRADKSTVAPYQPLSKYLYPVEEFFREEELKSGKKLKRRLFIATDEKEIISEAKKLLPTYTILANVTAIANTKGVAGDKHNYGDNFTLEDVILDILVLANVDFCVCTLSSNVCRAAYQMRVAKFPNAAETTVTLDVEWYVTRWSHGYVYRVVRNHTVPASSESHELELLEGDRVHSLTVPGLVTHKWHKTPVPKLQDGRMLGVNERTHKFGLYPRFKVVLDREAMEA